MQEYFSPSDKELKEYIHQLLRESLYKEPREDRFLRAKDIRSRYGISDPTIHRWTSSGKLPKPEYLNGMRVWRQSVIEAAEQQMLDSPERMPNRLGVEHD